MAKIQVKPEEEITDNGKWYELRPRQLYALRPPTWEEYEESAYTFAAMKEKMPFWIGDFVNIGEATFGEKYAQVLNIFGEYAYSTIANYTSIMRRVKPDVRTEKLFFGHHDAVAAQDRKAQKYWLKRAEKEKLTVSKLRELIRAKNTGNGDGQPEIEIAEPTFSQYVEASLENARSAYAKAPKKWKPFVQTAIDSLAECAAQILTDDKVKA